MATIIANLSTDFNDIDLNFAISSWFDETNDTAPLTREFTWADITQLWQEQNVHHISGLSALPVGSTMGFMWSEAGFFSGTFNYYHGTNFTYDASGVINGGTVRVMEAYSAAMESQYIIYGVSVSGAALGRAFNSDSVTDDYALMASALAGRDRFYLSNEADLARGYAGNDIMFGRGGQDDLRGDAGNDRISGGAGSDYLYGGSGADRLAGNAGIDFLYGGRGRDRLTGGAGADQFHFTSMRDSTLTRTDVITDFRSGTDVIRLMEIDASTGRDGNNAFVFLGTATFGTDIEGGVRYERVNNAGTANDYTMVYLDNDSDAAAEGAIRINGLHTLTAHDFLL